MRRKDFLDLRLGKPRRITAGLTHHEHPAVSPDAHWIAYYAGEYGSIEILVCDLQGRLARRASPFSGNSTQPAWHPDCRRLAYRHQHAPDSKWEIWETTLIVPPPAPAKKGKSKDKAEASAAPQVLEGPGDADDPGQPSDEHTLPRPLLADPRYDYKHPCYSPDGGRMVYFSDEDSPGIFHLWLLNLDSGEKLQLTFGDSQNHCHPVFSPDGTRIVYHAYEGVDTGSTEPVTNLYELALHTGEVLRLTDRDDQDKHPFYLDDNTITFHHQRNDNGRRGIRALHLPSAQELVLTEGEHNDKHPFPWFDSRGVAHLAWASKKLGERHDGEPSTYDIFVAKFRRS